MDNISIFFDTNIIESQFSCDRQNFLFHGEITPSKKFHDVVNFIKEADLTRITTFYISEISWKEFNLHLVENYENRIKDMKRHVEAYSKSFSSIVDIEYEIKRESKSDYIDHINELGKFFLSKYKCKIIEYPRDIELLESLIDKCINKKKPFVSVKISGKDYNDAGLKDALIWESILRHRDESNELCLFVTDDKDFEGVSDIVVCKSLDDVKKSIAKCFEIKDFTIIKAKIDTNDYLKEQIIVSTGNEYNPKSTDLDFDITSVSCQNEEHTVYKIDITYIINETKYLIDCLFDSVSNEIIDLKYKTENE